MDDRPPVPEGGEASELRARLAATEAELGAVRYELSRLASRRLVRIALLLSSALRRGGGRAALRHLPAVLRGGMPVRDPVPHPGVSNRHPYPHLTVTSGRGNGPFASVAPHVATDGHRSEVIDEPPADLHLVDLRTGSGERRTPPDDAPLVVLVDSEDQLSHELTDHADLVVTEDVSLRDAARRATGERALVSPPSVDITTTNPIGWRREPSGRLVQLRPATSAAETRDHKVATVDPSLFPTEHSLVRAVLDAVAVGTPVVFEPGREPPAIVDGLVSVPMNAQEHRGELDRLASDLDERERTSVRVRRQVLSVHSRRARFEDILDRLDIPLRAPDLISVLLSSNRPEQVGPAIEQVTGQDHPRIELVVILHGEGFDDVEVERHVGSLPTKVVRAPGHWLLGDCYNAALDVAAGTVVAKMDDDDLYGPHHLSDLVLAREYSGADVVGRTSNFVHLSSSDRTVSFDVERQERWDPHHLPGPAMLWDAALLRRVRFRRVPRAIDTHALRDAYRAGARVYATHRYQMVRARHGSHTYEEKDRHFHRRAGNQVWEGLRTDIAFT
jgi:hypothetical protein